MGWWQWLFWGIAGVLGAGSAATLYLALAHDRARGRARCPGCWYQLTGRLGERCPECGQVVRQVRSLYRTRRHWKLALVGAAIGGVAAAAGVTPRIVKWGTGWAAVPTPALLVVVQVYDDPAAQLLYRLCNEAGIRGQDFNAVERWLLARYLGRLVGAAGPGSGAVVGTKGYAAAIILQTLGTSGRPALWPLVAAALNPKHPLRHQAVRAIGVMADSARGAVPALISLIETDTGSRDDALMAITDIGPAASAAFPAVRRLFESHASESTRLGTVVAAYCIGGPRDATRDLLIEATRDPSEYVRCAAVNGLERLGLSDEPTRRALRELCDDPANWLGATARWRLRQIEAGRPSP